MSLKWSLRNRIQSEPSRPRTVIVTTQAIARDQCAMRRVLRLGRPTGRILRSLKTAESTAEHQRHRCEIHGSPQHVHVKPSG